MFKVTIRYTKLPKYVCFEYWLASVKIILVIFFSCLCLYYFGWSWLFWHIFWHWIFDNFGCIFDPRFTRVKNYSQKCLKFITCKKYVEIIMTGQIILTNTRKKITCLKLISAYQYSKQMYIYNYYDNNFDLLI